MRPEFREVRRAIYAIKRRFGQPFLARRTTNDATDFSTGKNFANLTSVFVRRGAFMSAMDVRGFMRTITDTARIQNFAYGGMFDARTRFLLLSQRDLPTDFPIDENIHIVFPVDDFGNLTGASKRWEVKGLEEYEEQELLVLTLQSVDGAILDPTVPNPNPPQPPPPAPGRAILFQAQTTNKVLGLQDSGYTYSNIGAVAEVDFTLPTPAPGLQYTFIVEVAQIIKVTTPAGSVIGLGGQVSTDGGNVTSDVPISQLTLTGTSVGTWAASFGGQWNVN